MGKTKEELIQLLREVSMRAQITFPENEVDEKHFTEEFYNQSELMQTLHSVLSLGDYIEVHTKKSAPHRLKMKDDE